MKKKLSSWQRYKLKHPDRVRRHNARRHKRADRRYPTQWHKRLYLLRLHVGEFHKRDKEKHYEGVEVKLSHLELAVVWFRDKAWSMRRPEVDRIDPDGHYEFSNVRFVEHEVNQERRRKPIKEEAPF